MPIEVWAAIVLIAVPIAFNVAFFELGRSFDYPNILRKPPEEVLRRFAAGGSGLLLRWQALLLSALGMLPVVALLAVALDTAPGFTGLALVLGTAAALVQAIGLVRWPFAVPELARRYAAAEGPDGAAEQRAIVVEFATLNRLFGVGIGEHLGYLLTGLWTLVVSTSIFFQPPMPDGLPWDLPSWIGLVGLPIGIALLVGSLEFVGPNEPKGWAPASTIVPIAYIAWSLWLVAMGILLLIGSLVAAGRAIGP